MLNKILTLMFSTNVTALLLTTPMMFFSASASGQSNTENLLEQEQSQSRWSLELGVDYTSQYFFRGIIQENDGAIIQPWAEAGVRRFENESVSISGFFGIWNSFHSQTSTAGVTDGAIEH